MTLVAEIVGTGVGLGVTVAVGSCSASAAEILDELATDPVWGPRAAALSADFAPAEISASTVALHRRSGQYLVDVGLDNRATGRLLLDTGASISALSRPALQILQRKTQIEYRREQTLVTAGGRIDVPVYRMRQVSVGDHVFGDIEFDHSVAGRNKHVDLLAHRATGTTMRTEAVDEQLSGTRGLRKEIEQRCCGPAFGGARGDVHVRGIQKPRDAQPDDGANDQFHLS